MPLERRHLMPLTPRLMLRHYAITPLDTTPYFRDFLLLPLRLRHLMLITLPPPPMATLAI